MLLDKLNEEKTIQNVNVLLENYDRLKRIASSSLDLKSPKFDDMPKAQSIKNPSEEKIVRRLQAKQEFDAINKSIENLPGEHGRYRYILKHLYIYRTRPIEKIYRELHIEKDPKESHVEYIRIYFDVEEEKVFFYFQYPIASVGKVTNSTFKTFIELKKLIFQVFKLDIINQDTEKQVFKVYKKYTEDNEQEYTQMLDTIDKSEFPSKKSLFNNFYETVVSKLKEKAFSHDKNIYIERIKRVFIRMYADNHFDEFTKNIKSNEGYITGFIYKDTLGSSVTGKNGYGQSLDDIEINPLQASDTYFDNRDTIYASEKLFSVRVKLQPSRDIFFERDVRFQAFDGVLLIHFIKEPVNDEKVEYVLQQFESIV